jgi:hypothetical protein
LTLSQVTITTRIMWWLQVTDVRENEMRNDLDSLQGRHVQLKRKFKALVAAYRQVSKPRRSVLRCAALCTHFCMPACVHVLL